jgi:16S rRNA (uracil1498-N3)-methyltransferase
MRGSMCHDRAGPQFTGRATGEAQPRSMKPPRVYHRGPLQAGRDVTLDEAASRHLGRVLRMRPGDPLVVFDGSGGEYRAVLRAAGRDAMRVHIEAFDPRECESALRVGLAQAISGAELMDLTVQKAVELGAAWIQPLLALRGKVRLEPARAERRAEHWQRIAIAACEQCGRNRVPEIRPVRTLADWLGRRDAGARGILLDPAADTPLSRLAPAAGEIALLAGPESGFAEEENAMARHMGFEPVSLGPRVLRTETAGLAALAAMQALWGDS